MTLFGWPHEVTAFVGTQREGNETGFEDSCTVLLGYEGGSEAGKGEGKVGKAGLLVTVKAAVVSVEERQLRFWVRGDKGSFKKVNRPLL